jgi:Heparinase II/III-like protein/Heparinase II/III N-terminus
MTPGEADPDKLNDLSIIREKLSGLTTREIIAEASLRASRYLRRAFRRALDSPDSTRVSDAELSGAFARGVTAASAAESFRKSNRSHLLAGLNDPQATAERLKQMFPESIEQTIREADEAVNHRVRLFNTVFDLRQTIDWHADPQTGLQWPPAHFTAVPLVLAEGSDVRRVWELNRLHHFTILGRAYILTGDDRYAGHLLNQFVSWCEANPPRFGANWTVAMEVAIRAINILAALQMIRGSELMNEAMIVQIYKSLVAHGRFIRNNLEFSHRTASNHYLSDLIGLFALGVCLPELAASKRWARFAGKRLIGEMDRQVLPDGVDYEGAIGYHRLVLEIFTLHFALSRAGGIELPGEYRERLRAMFDFVLHYLKPDGTAPAVGDSDDGRLLKFKQRATNDHSYLLSLGAVLLDDAGLKPAALDPEAVWWFGSEGCDAFEKLPDRGTRPESKAFSNAQIFIQRSDDLYAIIDCGDHGAGGRGSHAHSDALSLEVFAFGRTFLRDPGTFAYTASERWRNIFRSTAYHNTAKVDGREISRITPGSLFTLGPNVRPRVNRWECGDEQDLLDAEHCAHAGSQRRDGVVHRRVITFNKLDGYWRVQDSFAGAGEHQFEFFFNFDAGLEVTVAENQRAIAVDDNCGLAIAALPAEGLTVETVERWVSPSYGVKLRSSGIIYRARRKVPFTFEVLLIPYRSESELRVEEIVTREFSRNASPRTQDDQGVVQRGQ